MNVDAANHESFESPKTWKRLGLRGIKVVVCCIVIALCLTAMFEDELKSSVIYSLCIGLSCWLFIDVGGDVVASWFSMPSFGADCARAGWRGLAWMATVVAVGATLGYAVGNEIANAITGMHKPGPFNANLSEMKSVLVLAFVPAITITYFLISRDIIATQKVEVETAQRQATEQQLKLLESQLEPHMLFNTLANLRVLIGLDPPRAQAMLDQLIAFLRSSLDGSRARLHPVQAEFQRLRDYLALMQIRMGPRLETGFDLPAALASALVPPLLLQPLVENGIKHGLEPHVAGGRIDVSAARDGDSLVLRVRDSGIGLDAGVTGEGRYGLAHVRERLATLYGDRATFDLAPAEAGGTLATIRLPLQTMDAGAPVKLS
ncbi:MAG: histidine kinase [Pseudomonadota bacterium]|nr:histidine kinase [Pseudomonadota bacterium]